MPKMIYQGDEEIKKIAINRINIMAIIDSEKDFLFHLAGLYGEILAINKNLIKKDNK